MRRRSIAAVAVAAIAAAPCVHNNLGSTPADAACVELDSSSVIGSSYFVAVL